MPYGQVCNRHTPSKLTKRAFERASEKDPLPRAQYASNEQAKRVGNLVSLTAIVYQIGFNFTQFLTIHVLYESEQPHDTGKLQKQHYLQ